LIVFELMQVWLSAFNRDIQRVSPGLHPTAQPVRLNSGQEIAAKHEEYRPTPWKLSFDYDTSEKIQP
jgi:hypothetical protein